LSDKDFSNIKYTEEFTQIVKKLEAMVFNEVNDQKKEVKKEEVKVEQKKEEVKEEVKVDQKKEDNFEEKAKQLIEMGFDLPVSVLVEFLKQCGGNLEKVINTLYNS